jgi:4,5-dihydroxyphthalate decarboxylase
MTTAAELEVRWEAQGSIPHYRYDQVQPLLQGRAKIDGVRLLLDEPAQNAGFFENERFKNGEFDLLDLNWGDSVPAIANGWDLKLIPVFVKRKPAYDYLWVRADRGIDAPKDLEGKTIATVGFGSAISIYTRGFLQRFYGVDISKLRWLSVGPERFPVHNPDMTIEYAAGPRKSPVERLLAGEVDACTGDITDVKAWDALEASGDVKLMFPDFQERNRQLFREQGILTPVHCLVIGGRLQRVHPDLALRVYEGFERSRLQAYDDALGDGTGYSLTVHHRKAFQAQLREWGDVWKHGLTANRGTVDAFLDYNFEQGLTKSRLSLEEVFAAGTLDT